MTLFIPHGVEGFVSRQDGSVSLHNILIPIAPIPRAQPAIAAAVRLSHGCEIISDPGVIPIKFRAPGGTVAELVPVGRYKQPHSQ